MAIYDYRCENCGAEFTVSETISEHERRRKSPKCPDCDSGRTRRVFTEFFAKTESKV
ncbi:MAG: zinc ribbon domain-containing protein [Gemmatimonadota bacterium]|nr:zinc ribbon domain-containing protein [Gemmatimonadota bacterium]